MLKSSLALTLSLTLLSDKKKPLDQLHGKY
jgi:hypothetical protein